MLPPAPMQEARPRVGIVDAAITADLAKSALGREHIGALGVTLADPNELVALGRKPIKTMVIPYFSLEGVKTDFKRYRYLEDPRTSWEKLVTKAKAQRYFQPAGTGLQAYFPPLVKWVPIAGDPKTPIIITEGEKKAACATAHGFPTIGLGGVDCFSSKKDDSALLPELMAFSWKERDVVICYDSDAASNPNVLAASVRLGRKLYNLGASVRIAALQPTKDGEKVGLDDFIATTINEGGSVKVAMAMLLATASSELFEREIALHEFNQQFVYVRDLDKVIVREDKKLLNPSAFVERFMAAACHREWVLKTRKDGKIVREGKPTSTAQAWMRWQERLTRKRLEFVPAGPEILPDGYNMWPGFSTKPIEGDASLWAALLDHLFKPEDKSARDWFEKWLAYPLQHPGAKLKTACLLWSRAEGTGKSTVLESMRAVYGSLFVPMNDSAVDLKYTDWLVNKLLVGVDDVAAKNRDDHAAKWKNLITAPKITVQEKYVPTYEINLHANFIMTSNESNALRLSPLDRRYFVYETTAWATVEERKAFFGQYYDWLHSAEGASALMHHLMNLDLAGFNPDAYAPVTDAKLSMQAASLGPMEQWTRDLVDAPDAMLRLNGEPLPGDLWTAEDLASVYNAHPNTLQKVTRIGMGMALAQANAGRACQGKQLRLGTNLRIRLFALRNIAEWENATPQAATAHYHKTRGGGK